MAVARTMSEFLSVLRNVKYKDWDLRMAEAAGGYLLKVYHGPSHQHRPSIPEWYISSFATDTEAVRTAYKAVMHAEMELITEDVDRSISVNYHTLPNSELGSPILDLVDKAVARFVYRNWTLRTERRDTGIMLQIVFTAPDNDNPDVMEEQHCRKFYFRPMQNESTIETMIRLQETIRYAVRAAEEHEINEMFTYKGRQIYNPHLDLDELVEFVDTVKMDHR